MVSGVRDVFDVLAERLGVTAESLADAVERQRVKLNTNRPTRREALTAARDADTEEAADGS